VVRFFRKSGTNSFADGDATVDGICQVCHTRTVAFNSSGTLEDPTNLHPKNVTGTDCKSCHTHTNNFKAACNACHGNPPVDAGTLVFNPGVTNSNTAGAHNAHVTTQGIGCATCHVNSVGSGATHNDGAPQTVTIGFSLFGGARLGGVYNGQSTVGYDKSDVNTSVSSGGSLQCDNIYCHSTVQGTGGTGAPTYATPSWNNTPPNNVQCGSCHKADGTGDGSRMDSASHAKHVATTNYNMPCSNCHSGSGSGTSTHVDDTIQVSFATNYGGSYNGSDATPGNHAAGQGYGTCSTNYCHSTGTASPTYKTPVWGDATTGQCGACHGADAATPPSSSSHAKHVGSGSVYKFNCKKCHSTTVDATAADSTTKPGIADKTVHVMNKTRDVNLNTSDPLVGSLATNSGTDCTNIYCHSTGKAADVPATQLPTAYNGKHYSTVTWGDALTCASCHGKTQTTGTYKGYPDYTMADQNTDKGTARANST
jgi:predicted CxxxxCH...CXXCH cytochrome family protein